MLGNIISAGANIIGSIFGKRNADKQADMQKEFAQNGIQWRVQDAQAAGIHPLAALGAQTASYSPVSVGDVTSSLSAAGQDLGRAVDSTRSHADRDRAFLKSAQDLQLQRMGLENQLLTEQIARTRAAGSPPARPETDESRYLIAGQGSTFGRGLADRLVVDKPMERIAPAPGAPHAEPGAVSDIGYSRTRTGLAPVYSKDVKERLEDDSIGSLTWNLRNRLLPSVGANRSPPPLSALPKGYDSWRWNVLQQEYQPARRARYDFNIGPLRIRSKD
ncbi:MAG: DNA pilot protein [Arizlama microvirus]|nr:MAG: DNA pilot protein [Arizlama microvirus]